MFELVTLDKVLTQRKEFITIDNSIEYKRCRVMSHRKGVVLRDEVKGIAINTKKQQVCHTNDFIVAEIDAKVGGYGFIPEELNGSIVSSHYFLFELNPAKMDRDYLRWLIQTDIIQVQISSKGSTNYAAIRPKDVLSFKIPLPILTEQKRIIKKLNTLGTLYKTMSIEISSQLSNIQLLRQAILQEAVQGKLLPQDPKDEPASELLKRIKAEKAKQAKKGKAETYQPINDVPYEIPKGWAWCKIEDVSNVGTGATPLTSNAEYYKGNIAWITSSATGEPFVTKPEKFISQKALAETNCKVYPKGTLIVAMYGQGKTRGQITELSIEAATNQACAAIELYLKDGSHTKYIKYFFRKVYLEIRELAAGGAQPNLNLQKIKETLIPLPPLNEQKRIVAKVEQLMQLCDELEAQVQQSKADAEKLLQAVLREAFEGKKTYNTQDAPLSMAAEP